MQVKHSRFGKGKVINISGEGNNKKATEFFSWNWTKTTFIKIC